MLLIMAKSCPGIYKKSLTDYHNSEQVNKGCKDSDFFINYDEVHKLHVISSYKYNENIIMYNNINILFSFKGLLN